MIKKKLKYKKTKNYCYKINYQLNNKKMILKQKIIMIMTIIIFNKIKVKM